MFLIRGTWKLIKWSIKWSMITIVIGGILIFSLSFLPTAKEKLAAMSPQERIEYFAEQEVEKVARLAEKEANIAAKAAAREAEFAEHVRLEKENKAAIAVLIAEVKQIPASDFDTNIDYYKRLVRLAPSNEQFKGKLIYYQTQEQHRIALIAAKAAAREAEFAADAALVKARQEAAQNLLVSAFMVCKKSVLAQANYASKADFAWKIIGHVSPEGNGVVGGEVELMNGFGAMIPQRFVCMVKDKMVSHASLANN